MRIGLITAEYPPAIGGVGDHSARLAAALVELGHTVQVVTTGSERPERSAGTPDEVTVFRSIPRWDWRMLGAVRRFAHRQAWDVVHIQYQPAAYALHGAITLLPWWLRRARRPSVVVTTFHDLRVPYLFPKAGRLRQAAVRQMACSSQGAIAVAQEDRAVLVKWTLAAGRATAVEFVPLGNHFDAPPPAGFDRQRWRESLGFGPSTFLLGHVGLVNRSKGIDTLVRALAALRERGRDVRLLMIGDQLGTADPTNAPYLREIQDLIDAHSLDLAVRWTGYEPAARVSAWLRCLDLAVLPFTDGPTLRRTSLIGAWSHGVPALTTEPRQPTEWLGAAPAAAAAPPNDPQALAEAIAALQDTPDRRAALAQAGRAFSSRFSWPEVARRTLGVYRSARQIADRG